MRRRGRALDAPLRTVRRLGVLAALAVVSGAGPLAQFASGVSLVEVYATVTDRHDAPVVGLRQDDFDVFEDGVPQKITAFASGDIPLSVALAIDRSASMAGRPLALAKGAARAFLTELGPRDRAMVMAISGRNEVVVPLGTDRRAALEAVARLDAWSTTSLRDAIVDCVNAIEPAGGRRAAIVLSDGADRSSGATAADLLGRVRRADVLLYPIAIGRSRPPLFAELAAVTGGRSFLLKGADAISRTVAGIADELRHQYLLGYSPARPWDLARPEWRSIQVSVKRPGVHVRAREGYIAR